MTNIKTLAYFDLEATGLKSSGRPRISEICFVAVNVEDVKDLNLTIKNNLGNKNNQDYALKLEALLPRVLNKITLCVYPMATIMPEVSDITELDNYNLSGQTRFDANTGELLKSFLDRLPTPVCLVAHNGDIYDFPLLKAELEKVGIKLSSGILCADSYIGIKAIFKDRNSSAEDAKKKETQMKKINPQSFSLINLHNHMLGCNPSKSHGAEADCLALLKITAILGEEWLGWVKKNCKLFSECKKMWVWG